METNILKIDRSVPFDPNTFDDFRRWHSSIDGVHNLYWEMVDQDEKSLAITEFDIGNIELIQTLKANEFRVMTTEHLDRLKEQEHTLLDLKVFQALWENQSLIPSSWKENVDNEGCGDHIHFYGSILKPQLLWYRYSIYLQWFRDKWIWGLGLIRDYRCMYNPGDFTAVYKPKS